MSPAHELLVWIALLLVAGSLPAWAAVAAGDAPLPLLIWIGTDRTDRLVELAESGIPPARIVYGHGFALAWGSAPDLPRIERVAPGPAVLCTRRPGCSYAVVFEGGPEPGDTAAGPGRYGRILWRGPGVVVLEYDTADGEKLWSAYTIIPVSDRPVRFAAASASRPLMPVEPDPGIAAYAGQVKETELQEVTRRLQDFESRRSNSPGGFAAGAYLRDLFLSFGLDSVSYYDYNDWCDDVVAVQRGLFNPEEIYVIGGHYDSISRSGPAPGADDNASGTAAVVEAARILSRHAFEATIIYIVFSGEEQGLVGSGAWAAAAGEAGLDVRGMINLDMIGYVQGGDTPDLDLISDGGSAHLRDLAFRCVEWYVPDLPVKDGSLTGGGSDHMSFWQAGYPAVFFFEDSRRYSPFIHTSQDLIGTSLNNYDFMRMNVQAAIALLATLARPLRVRIEHTPLPDPPEPDDGFPLTAVIRANAPLDKDSLGVFYRIDGGPLAWIPLVPSSIAETYTAVLPRQPVKTLVEYAIHARDIEGRAGNDPPGFPERMHGFTVGLRSFFTDGFDRDLGWTYGGTGDRATSGAWIRAIPVGTGAQTATDAEGDTSGFCLLTANGPPGAEPGSADVDGGRTTVTSPGIDLSAAASVRLEYSLWFVDETHDDDSLRVYLSNDDGASWTLIEATGGGERRWRRVRLDGITDLLTPTDRMRIRFVAEDVGEPSLVEGAIDNVVLKGIIPRFEPPASPGPRIVQVCPVPFGGGSGVRILFDLPTEVAAAVDIYDVRGRRVATLAPARQTAGRHEIVWSGKTADGCEASSGVYFVRLVTPGGGGSSASLLKLR